MFCPAHKTPGRERAEGSRHQTEAAEARGLELTGGLLLEAGETDEIEIAVPARTGDRVVKIGTDAAKSGAPTATDDRVMKRSERLGRQEAVESRDQNGLTSEGFRGPSGLPMAEKPPVQAAGMLLEDQVPSELYKLQDGTDTGSLSATADQAPWSAVTAER